MSCSRLHDGVAYNKKDAEEMKVHPGVFEKQKADSSVSEVYNSTATDSSIAEVTADSISSVHKDSTAVIYQEDTTGFKYVIGEWWDKILFHALFPSEYSISGIGCIQYFKNDIGELLISMSLLLSIITLIGERFFRKKNKLILDFIVVNLVSVLAFIIDGFINHVELKYGVWCLLFILLIQLILELKRYTNQISAEQI